jgi:hypothetical protein
MIAASVQALLRARDAVEMSFAGLRLKIWIFFELKPAGTVTSISAAGKATLFLPVTSPPMIFELSDTNRQGLHCDVRPASELPA